MEWDEIRRMRLAGANIDDISRASGLSATWLYAELKKHGLLKMKRIPTMNTTVDPVLLADLENWFAANEERLSRREVSLQLRPLLGTETDHLLLRCREALKSLRFR